jgi:hypothetical protein
MSVFGVSSGTRALSSLVPSSAIFNIEERGFIAQPFNQFAHVRIWNTIFVLSARV